MLPTTDFGRARVAVIERIRSEFLEMPGLRLKSEQLQRLCGLDRATCEHVLDALVEMTFLCRKADGTYARVTDGVEAPPKATATPSLSSESTMLISEDTVAAVGRRIR